MKKTDKKMIWSSDISVELGTMEDIKEMFKENIEANNFYIPIESTEDENKCYEYASELVSDYYNDLQMEIETYENSHGEDTYIIIADIGRWNGRYHGGKVIKGLFNTFSNIFGNEDDAEFYQENGVLKARTSNHDATSYYTIHKLSDRGLAWYERNKDWRSRKDICETLGNDRHYYRQVKIFNEIYGW